MLFVRNSSLFVGPLDEALEEARVKNYGVPTVLDVGCGGGVFKRSEGEEAVESKK